MREISDKYTVRHVLQNDWSEHIRKVNVIKGKKRKSSGTALDTKGN